MDPYHWIDAGWSIRRFIHIVTIAFSGIMAAADLVEVILSQWLVKSAYEVIATPLTYWIVNSLKRVEKLDVYDRTTDFNPFKVQVDQPWTEETEL